LKISSKLDWKWNLIFGFLNQEDYNRYIQIPTYKTSFISYRLLIFKLCLISLKLNSITNLNILEQGIQIF